MEAGGGITVGADTDSTIWAAAAGFAFNDGLGGTQASEVNAYAFSVGVNVISTRTQASIRGTKGDQGVWADASVTVTATDSSEINALAGAGAMSSSTSNNDSTGVGISVALNTIITDIDASIEDTTLEADSLTLRASSDGTIRSLGFGGAVSGDLAIGGQISINWTNQDLSARMTDSTVTVIGGGGDLTIDATNRSAIQSLSGGAAVATGRKDITR